MIIDGNNKVSRNFFIRNYSIRIHSYRVFVCGYNSLIKTKK